MKLSKLNLFKITMCVSLCYMILNNIGIMDMPWWG